ncbi:MULTISPECIES: hypothetical protein [unclassified Achromobacter]|uniref:hypothetical protein n=1 Tax=unclassified Achromobacter TaxID=2626865 RepID=UPI000B5192B1|nr:MULTISPECIES: hypothetical protein [unclassified Achromobacter]OWT72935.1 hypothetical protein CEY05_23945 [Achromobacter sp. HZ34]OWT74153.1 hypothetical protein CEY04_22780 [Achromobacter sp. HZ28]
MHVSADKIRGARQLDRSDYMLLGSMKPQHPYVATLARERMQFAREYNDDYKTRIRRLNKLVKAGLVTIDSTIEQVRGGAYVITPAGEAAVALKKQEEAAARARRQSPIQNPA